ncbi:Hypothetical protein CINCED_3A015416 [Cinara cedri]|uniref:MD-2-related lipid-recognition domain-containing protein n=1 Tax=Cinara cedri TaxID=506608 RepID=A0A5E4LYS5_9HEMI|nr:Hypothetical protein CINCED_3A015416 [Cinara cedri]
MNHFSMFLLVLVTSALSKNEKLNFFPNLPVGEYKVYPRAIIQCKQKQHLFEFNMYLNRISSNTSEVKGNITCTKPIDDSDNIVIINAVKDSIGGWKDNALILKISKACSSFEKVFGNLRTTLNLTTKNNNVNRNCPYPAGVYVSNGFDFTSFIANANLPKQFFYGVYKARFEMFDKKNNQIGCVIFVIEFKRPWETE